MEDELDLRVVFALTVVSCALFPFISVLDTLQGCFVTMAENVQEFSLLKRRWFC